MPHIGETLPKAQVKSRVLPKLSLNMRLNQRFMFNSCFHQPSSCKKETSIPTDVQGLWAEFFDVFSTELPSRFPPLWDIQHQIDLYPDVSLSNTKNYVVKWKTWYLKATYERVRVHVLTLFFLCPRKRGLGKCTLTGEPSIKLPFGIAFLSRD